jgi:shikimate dehydrogenase
MQLYGLIGKKLTHSFSPDYFAKKFNQLKIDAEYRLFEINSIDEFIEVVDKNPELKGLNVTVPHKVDIMSYLHDIDPVAENVGSVNTVKLDWIDNKPFLKGYNTDIIGFEKSLRNAMEGKSIDYALVLGTGGSSKAVTYVLRKLKIRHLSVSRKPEAADQIPYAKIDEHIIAKHHLIINTSPLGMFPDVHHAPDLPYQHLSKNHVLFDLVYNPAETRFMKLGRENGAYVKNGMEMLHLQAEESWRIWQG